MVPRTYDHPKPEDFELSTILSALSDPIRIEMVRRLANRKEHDSLTLADDLPRSTLTYHTRILRQAGVTWTRSEGRSCLISLRINDLENTFPGVLPAILANIAKRR